MLKQIKTVLIAMHRIQDTLGQHINPGINLPAEQTINDVLGQADSCAVVHAMRALAPWYAAPTDDPLAAFNCLDNDLNKSVPNYEALVVVALGLLHIIDEPDKHHHAHTIQVYRDTVDAAVLCQTVGTVALARNDDETLAVDFNDDNRLVPLRISADPITLQNRQCELLEDILNVLKRSGMSRIQPATIAR